MNKNILGSIFLSVSLYFTLSVELTLSLFLCLHHRRHTRDTDYVFSNILFEKIFCHKWYIFDHFGLHEQHGRVSGVCSL